ncbi:hypothetical protein CEXT_404101 [Caerostris extrusa]|uniref:Uncharacterized protein n=1 Tax=Caerostris extrusa TaxID=172846 RepID=A0AAV4NFX2_CAEEX|nr:hypothetical protein CEXT_404101 [Caerostris extrusa]
MAINRRDIKYSPSELLFLRILLWQKCRTGAGAFSQATTSDLHVKYAYLADDEVCYTKGKCLNFSKEFNILPDQELNPCSKLVEIINTI